MATHMVGRTMRVRIARSTGFVSLIARAAGGDGHQTVQMPTAKAPLARRRVALDSVASLALSGHRNSLGF